MQNLIKKIAERYGLGYDEKQENPTIMLSDGEIKEVKAEDLKDIFNVKK